MDILFLGAGGVGGYFGARLMEAGANVTFLVRPRRYAQLLEDGLRVESSQGNVRMPAQAITRIRRSYDLLVVACKAWDLPAAIDSLQPAAGLDSLILPLLNGLDQYPQLEAAFGAGRVLGGLCHIPITLDPDGTVRHLSPVHRLVFGARVPSQREGVAALAGEFRGTRCDWSVSDDIMQDAWEKFFFLTSFAAGTCLMRGPVGRIVSQPGGRDFLEGLLEECRHVAVAEGFTPRPTELVEYRRQLTDPASPVNASMARDMAAGNRTEAEHVLGDMATRARRHGITTPLLDLALLHLRVYEAGRPDA